MILVLHKLSHVSSVLHQYPIYLLHRNEHVHRVQEACGKHAQDADYFKVVDGVGVKEEGFAAKDLVVAGDILSDRAKHFGSHTNVAEETNNEADDAV